MIELGKRQLLEVVRVKEFGIYLGEKSDDEAAVLLPRKQVPEGTKIGDKLDVFIYKDSYYIGSKAAGGGSGGSDCKGSRKNRSIPGYGAGERFVASI